MKTKEVNRGIGFESSSSERGQGVSVVICCHNSAHRIVETLNCLQVQQGCHKIPWEVVLVDNNSTDETVSVATSQWEKNPIVKLRVVTETKIGLSYARLKGISEASFEIISFIDDDNWVNSDWISQLPSLFMQNPDMAAVGGLILAHFESQEPSWFSKFEGYYAVGAQALSEGELDDYRGYLCGAGLTVRKSVLDCLFLNGFHFELVGRQGRNLLCSEDLELGLALRLAGWKLHYRSSLQMRHYMPQTRMDWNYLRRLSRGVGISNSGIIPYYIVLGGNQRNAGDLWVRTTARAILSAVKYSLKKLRFLGKHGVGHADDLTFERCIGLLYGMFIRRKKFIQSVEHLRGIAWKSCSPSQISNRAGSTCLEIERNQCDQ